MFWFWKIDHEPSKYQLYFPNIDSYPKYWFLCLLNSRSWDCFVGLSVFVWNLLSLLLFSKYRKKTWTWNYFTKFWANLWIFILKPSDVGQQIHSFKKGLYKWDLVKFNGTSQKITMTNIRDGLIRTQVILYDSKQLAIFRKKV